MTILGFPHARSSASALALGGAGFAGKAARRLFPAALHARNFRQLEEFASSLAPRVG